MALDYNNEAFLYAAKKGDVSDVSLYLRLGADINCQDPENGATALHYVAARQIRSVLKILIKHEDIDFLIRDHKKRLPSDLAYEVANDPTTGRYLVMREIRQAKKLGIDYKAFLTGRESPRVGADSLV